MYKQNGIGLKSVEKIMQTVCLKGDAGSQKVIWRKTGRLLGCRVQKRLKETSGQTLTELLAVLSIMAVLLVSVGLCGTGLLETRDRVLWQQEGNRIFEKIQQQRDRAMLLEARHGDRVRFYPDCVDFGSFDPAKNRWHYERLWLKTVRLQGYLTGRELIFYREGTVNTGGTLILSGKGGLRRTLVVQPGTGRIYMKDD